MVINMISMIREKFKILFPSMDEYLLNRIIQDLRDKATNHSLQMLIKELDKAIAESREVFKHSLLNSTTYKHKALIASLENSDKEFREAIEKLIKRYANLTDEEREKLRKMLEKLARNKMSNIR